MANSRSSAKRARQGVSRNRRNASQRSAMRTALKKTNKIIAAGEDSAEACKKLTSQLDRMARKGLIHKNKAARHKSRISKQTHAAAS